jgi:hypothetical protein
MALVDLEVRRPIAAIAAQRGACERGEEATEEESAHDDEAEGSTDRIEAIESPEKLSTIESTPSGGGLAL